MSEVMIEDERMTGIVQLQSSLQRLSSAAVWGEGPLYWAEDDSVIWSDAHGDRLLRWSKQQELTVLRQPSHYQNGNARDLEGRIVACSSGDRAIVRQEHDGTWRILVDRYQDKRLNSPNDLKVKRDGTIWFTDPPFGLTQPDQGYGGEQEQPGSYVYRFDPQTDEIDPVIYDMMRPNGLTFSPGEDLLYVSDSAAFEILLGPHHVRVYDVVGSRSVENSRIFTNVEPGEPDGLGVDAEGNVFVCAADGVQVYAPDSTRLGKILTPEICSNLTFGGPFGNCLFITAGQSLYAIQLCTHGVGYSKHVQ